MSFFVGTKSLTTKHNSLSKTQQTKHISSVIELFIYSLKNDNFLKAFMSSLFDQHLSLHMFIIGRSIETRTKPISYVVDQAKWVTPINGQKHERVSTCHQGCQLCRMYRIRLILSSYCMSNIVYLTRTVKVADVKVADQVASLIIAPHVSLSCTVLFFLLNI